MVSSLYAARVAATFVTDLRRIAARECARGGGGGSCSGGDGREEAGTAVVDSLPLVVASNLSILSKVYEDSHVPLAVAVLSSRGSEQAAQDSSWAEPAASSSSSSSSSSGREREGLSEGESSDDNMEDMLEVWIGDDELLSLPLYLACSPALGGGAVVDPQQALKARRQLQQPDAACNLT